MLLIKVRVLGPERGWKHRALSSRVESGEGEAEAGVWGGLGVLLEQLGR